MLTKKFFFYKLYIPFFGYKNTLIKKYILQTKYIKKREQRHKRCIKIVCKRLMNTSKKFS